MVDSNVAVLNCDVPKEEEKRIKVDIAAREGDKKGEERRESEEEEGAGDNAGGISTGKEEEGDGAEEKTA